MQIAFFTIPIQLYFWPTFFGRGMRKMKYGVGMASFYEKTSYTQKALLFWRIFSLVRFWSFLWISKNVKKSRNRNPFYALPSNILVFNFWGWQRMKVFLLKVLLSCFIPYFTCKNQKPFCIGIQNIDFPQVFEMAKATRTFANRSSTNWNRIDSVLLLLLLTRKRKMS